MSNSKLVCYTKISPNSTNPRNHKIDKITIHHMAGNLSVETCGNVFAPASRQASSNYGIDSDGRVGMYVSEMNRSWCTSSRENDHRAVTIEVANDEIGGNWHVSDKALTKLIDLCVDICQRNGIEKLNYTGDKSGNLTMHKWFANTNCPGPYLESKFPYIAAEVNKRLGVETAPTTKVESAPTFPVLKKGSKGDSVKALQILLKGYGYSLGIWGVDSSFGSATENAVEAFQEDNNLEANGKVDPLTWDKLLGV